MYRRKDGRYMGEYTDATGKRRYLSGKVQNELALKRRQGAAKRQLPKYSQDVYREVRAELDEEYAAKQEHGGMSKVEHENFQKRQAEQERKNEAANKVYAGVGAFGGKRRNEPDARDFSNWDFVRLWRVRWVRPMPAESYRDILSALSLQEYAN